MDRSGKETLIRLREEKKAEKNWAEVKRLNRLLMEEELKSGETEVSYFPPKLQIEHSNICNAQCIMCSHYFTQNTHPRFADESLKEKIAPLLPYVEKITLHGVGEPLAHPHIAEFIDWYHSFGIQVTCNTNMAYMDESLVQAIHRAFTSITISCDGCTGETYEGIRKGLRFDRFCENVRMLRAGGSELKMRMHTVAMRQNIRELPGIVRLAAELGCCHITIVDLTAQDFMENKKDELRNYIATSRKYIQEAIAAAEESGIGIVYPQVLMEMPSELSLEEEQEAMERYPLFPSEEFQKELKKKYGGLSLSSNTIPAREEDFVRESPYRCEGICDYFAEAPYIDVNGDVFLCCVNWLHSLGNLYKHSFAEIWNNGLYQGLRRMFRMERLPRYCQGCIFLRNQMFTSRIRIPELDKSFWESAFDQAVSRIVQEKLEAADRQEKAGVQHKVEEGRMRRRMGEDHAD